MDAGSRSSTSFPGRAATTPRRVPSTRPCGALLAAITRPPGGLAAPSRDGEDAGGGASAPLALSLRADPARCPGRPAPARCLPRVAASARPQSCWLYAAALRPVPVQLPYAGIQHAPAAGCWTGSEPGNSRRAAARHSIYVERLAAGGVLWALAESLTVIADPHSDLHPVRGGSRAAAGKQAARLHARLGTTTLAGVVARSPLGKCRSRRWSIFRS